MGTRGFLGFINNGVEKITYNHHDSYPDGLGVDVLNWARGADFDKAREQAAAIRVVDEQSSPTVEEAIEFALHTDSRVSEGDDWYAVLRGLQGSLQGYLDAGIMTDGHTFPLDSLFAEWGYLINLDDSTLEVYRGFQTTLPTTGRWAGRPTTEENALHYGEHVAWCDKNDRDPWMDEVPKYKAVALAAVWPLHDLPDDDEYLTTLMGDEG